MTASADPLHDDLYIDLINRTGTDINLTIVFRQYERSLDLFNIEKLIGCLGSNDGWALDSKMLASRDRKYIPIYFSTADYRRFCTVGCHIITQKLSYISNIRATSSQISRCFKRPDSRSGHEIVGIYQNPCIHTVCFHGIQTQIISDILENFCYHLTCRRCIWLNVGQNGILDHLIALSVMVQNGNRLRQTEQTFTFCHLWLVGIHNDDHSIIICQFFCLMGSHKQIIRILRII